VYWLLTFRFKNKRFSRHEFTMVEIMVVAVIFSILAISISATFMSGIKIWKRAAQMGSNYSGLVIAFEKISKELHQSVAVPQINGEGSSSEFSLSALNGNYIYKIVYRFDPKQKVFFRKEVSLKDILSGNEKEKYSERKLLDLQDFSASFLCYDPKSRSYRWQDSFTKEDGAFVLVKLYAKHHDETFTKIIFNPRQ
jgi:hypothetical protein